MNDTFRDVELLEAAYFQFFEALNVLMSIKTSDGHCFFILRALVLFADVTNFVFSPFATIVLASRPEDETEMQKVQDRFAVQVPELPDQIDMSSYSKYCLVCC